MSLRDPQNCRFATLKMITIAEKLGALLLDKKLSLSTAESCTGGGIAAAVTAVPGSSGYFIGSVVAYSCRVKMDLLGVRPETLDREGVVSRQTVIEMARGAMKAMKTDCAVATSGVAGPGGGTEETPVGTIWIAAAYKNEISTLMLSENHGRTENVAQAVEKALDLMYRMLK